MEKLTADQLNKSNQKNSRDLSNIISSVEFSAGRLPSTLQDGPELDLFGQALAPANLSAQRVSVKAKTTNDMSGRNSFGSLESAALTQSLANRLKERLGTGGSMEYSQTWKEKATPAGRLYWAHTARAHPTCDSGCTGWPTTGAQDEKWRYSTTEMALKRKESGRQICLEALAHLVKQAALVGYPTPNVCDVNASRSDRAQQYSTRWMLRKNHSSQLAHTVQAFAGYPTPTSEPSSGEVNANLERHGNKWRNKVTGRILQTTLTTEMKLGLTGPNSTSSTSSTEKRGALNPALSRWLMGYPVAWCQAAILASRMLKQRAKRV